jgi:hypothetical protein
LSGPTWLIMKVGKRVYTEFRTKGFRFQLDRLLKK